MGFEEDSMSETVREFNLDAEPFQTRPVKSYVAVFKALLDERSLLLLKIHEIDLAIAKMRALEPE